MTGIYNFTDVFEEIIDRFNDGPLSKHQFIRQIHQDVFHYYCNQGNSPAEQTLEQFGGQVPLIGE